MANNITIEGARIGFRNFSGEAGKFNPEGRRNFCVFLDREDGERLADEGWNVRWLKPKDEYEDDVPYLQVSVMFGKIPPKIVLVNSRGKTSLDEGSVGILDWAEIANVDLIIRPYHWEMGAKTGVKAYVKTMYVTIEEDEFESKYYDTPDSAMNSFIDEDN